MIGLLKKNNIGGIHSIIINPNNRNIKLSIKALPNSISSGVGLSCIVKSPKIINGILIEMPELELKTSAIMTMIIILFSGKNQFATNFDALIILKGNPNNDINYPIKKNQKETLIKIANIDPINVNPQPIIINLLYL